MALHRQTGERRADLRDPARRRGREGEDPGRREGSSQRSLHLSQRPLPSGDTQMTDVDYTRTFTTDQRAEVVFDAINNVRGWWSQAIEGDTDKLGAVFYYHYQDVHRCTVKITEFVPGRRVVW